MSALTKDEKNTITAMLKQQCTIHISTMTRLYKGSATGWIDTNITGPTSFVTNHQRNNTFYIIMLDNASKAISYETRVDQHTIYRRMSNHFHSFQASDGALMALSFFNVDDAQKFYETVTDKITASTSSPAPLASPSSSTSVQSRQNSYITTLLPLTSIPNTTTYVSGPGQHYSTRYRLQPSTSSSEVDATVKSMHSPMAVTSPQPTVAATVPEPQPQQKHRIKKMLRSLFKKSEVQEPTPPPPTMEISGPINFKHEGHIGWDPEHGFEMKNLPPGWSRIFEKAGLKQSDLGDVDTFKLIMRVIDDTITTQQNQAQTPAPYQSILSPKSMGAGYMPGTIGSLKAAVPEGAVPGDGPSQIHLTAAPPARPIQFMPPQTTLKRRESTTVAQIVELPTTTTPPVKPRTMDGFSVLSPSKTAPLTAQRPSLPPSTPSTPSTPPLLQPSISAPFKLRSQAPNRPLPPLPPKEMPRRPAPGPPCSNGVPPQQPPQPPQQAAQQAAPPLPPRALPLTPPAGSPVISAALPTFVPPPIPSTPTSTEPQSLPVECPAASAVPLRPPVTRQPSLDTLSRKSIVPPPPPPPPPMVVPSQPSAKLKEVIPENKEFDKLEAAYDEMAETQQPNSLLAELSAVKLHKTETNALPDISAVQDEDVLVQAIRRAMNTRRMNLHENEDDAPDDDPDKAFE